MTFKRLNITVKLITLSALIPSLYLFGITLFLLFPALIENIEYNSVSETIFLFLGMIFGILGFVGLSIELFAYLYSKIKTKILLLSLGIIGYILFVSIFSGVKGWKNMFESLTNIQENLSDFYFVIWPNIISILLIFINFKLRNKFRNNFS